MSLIVGKQKEPEMSDSGKTYNGVGKSLAIALLHFCLGSNKNEAFETAIPGWEFTLRFAIQGETFVSTRATSSQEKIILNGDERGVKKFGEILAEKLFDIGEPVPFLKFRPLIKRFIRPGKDSYVSFDLRVCSRRFCAFKGSSYFSIQVNLFPNRNPRISMLRNFPLGTWKF